MMRDRPVRQRNASGFGWPNFAASAGTQDSLALVRTCPSGGATLDGIGLDLDGASAGTLCVVGFGPPQ